MSIQTRMIDALRAAGLDAVLPGTRDAPCQSLYYVVADSGRRAVSKNNALRIFLLTAYVPFGTPTKLEGAVTAAREALLALSNVRTDGETSEAGYDDALKAVFVSMEYTALCAI